MKNFILLIIVSFVFSKSIAQITLIPDPYFEQALIDQGIDSDGIINGQVLTSDVENLTVLNISNYSIQDLTGIEDFTSLEIFICELILLEGHLDLTNNTQLNTFSGYQSRITSIDVTNCPLLKKLDVSNNDLSSIDVSNNLLLEDLDVGNPSSDTLPANHLTELDISNNINLKYLSVSLNWNLSSLDVSSNSNLLGLWLSHCDLSNLDLSNNNVLEVLNLGIYDPDFLFDPSNPNLTSIDLSTNINLTNLYVSNTTIENLNLSSNNNLELFYCENGNLNQLNLKNDNNEILDVFILSTPTLQCIQVDNAQGANNNDYPYSEWNIDHEITFTEDCFLANEDFKLNKLALYPNPVKEALHIENTENIEIEKITVYNILGKVVFIENNDFNKLNLSVLKSGILFVKIETERGAITKKIIKE